MAKIEQTFRTMGLKLHGEIRKAEWEDTSWTDKEGKLHESKIMKIKVLDDNDDMIELYDKNSDAVQTYAKGQVGTFTLCLDYKPTYGAGNHDGKMLVVGFAEDGRQVRRAAAPVAEN